MKKMYLLWNGQMFFSCRWLGCCHFSSHYKHFEILKINCTFSKLNILISVPEMAFGAGRGRMQHGVHRGYGVPSNGFQPRVMRNLVKNALKRSDFITLDKVVIKIKVLNICTFKIATPGKIFVYCSQIFVLHCRQPRLSNFTFYALKICLKNIMMIFQVVANLINACLEIIACSILHCLFIVWYRRTSSVTNAQLETNVQSGSCGFKNLTKKSFFRVFPNFTHFHSLHRLVLFPISQFAASVRYKCLWRFPCFINNWFKSW